MPPSVPDDRNNFEDLARRPSQSFIGEVWHLLSSDRRWWLAPIVIAIIIMGGLVMLSGTGVGPFIYTLF
jgi:uncharacterized protein DUF5989